MYNDPLTHLFNEFDVDNDGHLTAQELADALRCVLQHPWFHVMQVDVLPRMGTGKLCTQIFRYLLLSIPRCLCLMNKVGRAGV